MLTLFGVALGFAQGISELLYWRDEWGFVERTTKMNWDDVHRSPTTLALAHARVSDLSRTGATIPLRTTQDWDWRRSSPRSLPIGDRLWIIDADSVSYYEQGKVTP